MEMKTNIGNGGRIIFQGNYKELDQLDHPMVDEFVKSLEGFEDELTGLHSKKSFVNIYEKDLKPKEPHESVSAVVFTLNNLYEMNEKLGYTKTQELIQSLGENVNKHFRHVGTSIRTGTDQIATILPHTDYQTAERMLDDFARNLEVKGLSDIQAEAEAGTCSEGSTCSVSAGIAEGEASEDIDILSERAKSSQKIIARFQC
jgi:phospholipid/cholesterol/gamma-HCH transport system ATP-binding protein